MQTIISEIALTWAFGLTVIVKLVGIPMQLIPKLELMGVTVIVEVIGLVPLLIAVKLMSPVPEAFKPIKGFELLQVKDDASTPLNVIGPTAAPLQKVLFEMGFIIGVGNTLITAVSTAGKHGPFGSFVVKVKVIVPEKLAGGV